MLTNFYVFFFFFQAEDGIRDKLVTGVQTCALPICNKPPFPGIAGLWGKPTLMNSVETFAHVPVIAERGAGWWKSQGRSEEHTSELQSLAYLVCRLLLEKKKRNRTISNMFRNRSEHS